MSTYVKNIRTGAQVASTLIKELAFPNTQLSKKEIKDFVAEKSMPTALVAGAEVEPMLEAVYEAARKANGTKAAPTVAQINKVLGKAVGEAARKSERGRVAQDTRLSKTTREVVSFAKVYVESRKWTPEQMAGYLGVGVKKD